MALPAKKRGGPGQAVSPLLPLRDWTSAESGGGGRGHSGEPLSDRDLVRGLLPRPGLRAGGPPGAGLRGPRGGPRGRGILKGTKAMYRLGFFGLFLKNEKKKKGPFLLISPTDRNPPAFSLFEPKRGHGGPRGFWGGICLTGINRGNSGG